MMYSEEYTAQPKNRSMARWMTLGVMKRVEQVQCVAEMLSANMEDLAEQMEHLENCMDYLQEGTEVIQEKIEELTDMIQSELESPEKGGAGNTESLSDDSLLF